MPTQPPQPVFTARRSLPPLILAAALMLTAAGCAGGDQHWAVGMIERWSPPSPQQIARDAFDPYDADRRRRAISLLAAAPFGGEDPYVRMYRLLIGDNDATVRAASAQALGMHGDVEDADRLASLLEDDRAFVRWEAAKALQRIHNPSAIGPLARAARDDPDTDVRMAAAHALGQYPESRVVDVLIGTLNDREFSVVNAAHESLITLTGADLGIDSRDWLNWTRQRRGELFANGQPYRYQPYDPPPGFFERMRFWRDHASPEPRRPVGIDEDEAQVDDADDADAAQTDDAQANE